MYVRMKASQLNRNRIAVVLSKRERLGLVEAINLSLIDLKARTYAAEEGPVSLEEACHGLHLIDPVLLELLASSAGLRRNNRDLSIQECIQDSILQLEKVL